MPLDRRITIQEDRGTRNMHGEFVHDWQDFASVWAERRGAGSVDSPTEGGILVLEAVTFTVRYTSTLAALDMALIRILDAAGTVWNPESIAESDRRRRFLTFTATREAP